MMSLNSDQYRFRRIISDSALYGFAAVLAKALALLTVPYLTRTLSPSGYGVADLATSTAALLTLITMFGGDIPTARWVATAPDEQAKRRTLASYVWGTAAVSVTVSAALCLVAPAIASIAWGDPDLAPLASLALILVPVSAVQAAAAQIQRIRGRSRSFAILSLVDLLAQLALAVAFVGAGLGPAGVLLGFIVGSLIGLIAAVVAGRDTIARRPNARAAGRLVVHGMQFLPHVTMFVLADWIVRSIVAGDLGPAAVAELGVAIRVASVLSLLGAAFAMAWGPLGLAQVRGPATARHFGRILTAYGTVSVATSLVLGAMGPEVVAVIAGEGYAGAALLLPGFALAFAIAGTEYVLVVAAGISERGPRVAAAAGFGAVVQIAASAVIVASWGIAGVGLAAVLGRVVSFAVLFVGVRSAVATSSGWIGSVAGAAISFAVIQMGVAGGSSTLGVRLGAAGLIAVGGAYAYAVSRGMGRRSS